MKRFTYLNKPALPEISSEESETLGRHYITPSGMRVPSVTTVLGHFKKDSITQWRNKVGAEQADYIRNRAATRGTKFHAMMERYLGNEDKLFEGVMPDMKQAFFDIKSTLDQIDNIHYIEVPLYSETLGIAGRTDVIAEFAGVPSIIDFKTSTKEKKEEWITNYFEQGTAYSLMYEELTGETVKQIVIIISVDGTDTPQVFVKNRDDYTHSLTTKIEAYRKEHNYVR